MTKVEQFAVETCWPNATEKSSRAHSKSSRNVMVRGKDCVTKIADKSHCERCQIFMWIFSAARLMARFCGRNKQISLPLRHLLQFSQAWNESIMLRIWTWDFKPRIKMSLTIFNAIKAISHTHKQFHSSSFSNFHFLSIVVLSTVMRAWEAKEREIGKLTWT